MEINIEKSWKEVLKSEFEKPYFLNLVQFVKNEYVYHTCFPPGKEIFSALDQCPFDQVKVVIIGQDPYHGKGQANGMCFSVAEGVAFPPSLMNIFKELETDLGKPLPKNGDLSRWAQQGVLLLNATLTVREGLPGSHQGHGWETFTDTVIQQLSTQKENLVFLLWGGFAKSKARLIDKNRHFILTSGHPSPLSANRGYWFGNHHFSLCNEFLKRIGNREIEW